MIVRSIIARCALPRGAIIPTRARYLTALHRIRALEAPRVDRLSSVLRVYGRHFSFPAPQDVLMSPAGMSALLFGRTPSSSAKASKPDADAPTGSEGEETSRGFFANMSGDTIRLAVLIFLMSALWEVFSENKHRISQKLQEWLYLNLEIRSSQQEYAMIMDWIQSRPEVKNATNVTLMPSAASRWMENEDDCSTGRSMGEFEDWDIYSTDQEGCDPDERVLGKREQPFVLGHGTHRVKFGKHTLWITRSIDDSKKGKQSYRDQEDEALRIVVFSRDRGVLERLLESVRESWKERCRSSVKILISADDYWLPLCDRAKRPLDTLYLPKDVLESTVSDTQRFLGMRHVYQKLGVPWRRGYLFEGPPGTGKSSLILAMASEFSLPIHILSLRDPTLNDAKLLRLVNSAGPPGILVIEDIENVLGKSGFHAVDGHASASSGQSKRELTSAVSMSGLLNALDGFASSEGRITVVTSNNTSELPSRDALLRPGRVDRHVAFKPMSPVELESMLDNYIKCATTHERRFETEEAKEMLRQRVDSQGHVTPAEVQHILLSAMMSVQRSE